jgi:hypothetical protein
MPPVLPLVRVRDIAASAWVIVCEHAAYAERDVMGDAPDNRTPTSTLLTRKMP